MAHASSTWLRCARNGRVNVPPVLAVFVLVAVSVVPPTWIPLPEHHARADHLPTSAGDFVWLDLDADGIQDAGEPGVAGVTVNLYDDTAALVETAVTDSLGAYSFSAIDPMRNYDIEIVAPSGAFSPQDAGADDSVDSDVDATGRVSVRAEDLCPLPEYAALTLNAADAPVVFPTGTFGAPVVGGFQRFGGSGAVESFDASFVNGQNPFVVHADWQGNVDVTYEHLTPANTASNAFHSWYSAPESMVRVTSYDDFNWDTVISENGEFYKVNGRGIFGHSPSNEHRYTYEFTALAGGELPEHTFIAFSDFDGPTFGENALVSAAGLAVPGDPFLEYVTRRVVAGPQTPLGYDGTTNTYNFDAAVPSTNGSVLYWTSQPLQSLTIEVTQLGGGSSGFKMFAPFECADPGDLADAGVVPGSFVSLVWLDVDGDGVVDAGESGIEGVLVELTDVDGNVFSAVTDAAGEYVVDGLVPGEYSVQVVYPEAVFSPVGADADVDASGAVAVTVGSGVTAGAGDAGVLPAVVGDVVWLDVDGDGLQGVGEPGVAGVEVRLLDAGGVVLGSVVTDAAGEYVFEGLTPGVSYVVEVVYPEGGFVASDVGGDDTIDSDVGADGTVSVTPVSGDNLDAADAGVVPGSIEGTAWLDTNANGIQDPGEDDGVAGATITLLDAAGTAVAATTTSSTGGWAFTELPPGQYSVLLVAPPTPAGSPSSVYLLGPFQQGSDPTIDSDFDPVSGETPLLTVSSGALTNVDASLFIAGPDLDISKVAVTPDIPAGGVAEWVLTVTNVGTAVAPAPITVVDTLPDEVSFLDATGSGFDCVQASGVVTCVHAAPLPPGGEAQLSITARLASTVTGPVTNLASVSGVLSETNVANNVDSASVGRIPVTGSEAQRMASFGLVLAAGGALMLLGEAIFRRGRRRATRS